MNRNKAFATDVKNKYWKWSLLSTILQQQSLFACLCIIDKIKVFNSVKKNGKLLLPKPSTTFAWKPSQIFLRFLLPWLHLISFQALLIRTATFHYGQTPGLLAMMENSNENIIMSHSSVITSHVGKTTKETSLICASTINVVNSSDFHIPDQTFGFTSRNMAFIWKFWSTNVLGTVKIWFKRTQYCPQRSRQNVSFYSGNG